MESRAARGAGVRGRRVAVRRAVVGVEALEQRRLLSVTNLIEGANSAEAGGYAPADPNGAVGPNHVVNAVNTEIQWFTKTGANQKSEQFYDFFAPLGTNSSSFLSDPHVIYDQFNQRFVVVIISVKDPGLTGDVTSDSHVLMAVSDDADPNGTWYFQDINTKLNIDGSDAWLDYPGLSVSPDAIYLTGNMFAFSGFTSSVGTGEEAESGFFGSRLWIIPKSPLYSGAQSFVHAAYDPLELTGVTLDEDSGVFDISGAVRLAPAQMYATNGQFPTGLGTFLTFDAGIDAATGHNLLGVIEVDNPLGGDNVVFKKTIMDVGVVSTKAFHNSPQPWDVNGQYFVFNLGSGGEPNFLKVEANDERVLSAVWRDGSLYATQEVIPASGPDAGQVTAHWYRVKTGSATQVTALSLTDQGNIGGEEIGVGVNTFFPAVAVNARGDMAIGFSASGPISWQNNQNTTPTGAVVYAGAYVTTRLATDPVGVGFTRPSQVLAAGQDLFAITSLSFPDASRWGDYSGIWVDYDSSGNETNDFWAFNMYALPRDAGSFYPFSSNWGTRWGKFTPELVDLPAIGSRVWNDLNGNGIREDNEPGLEGVIFRLYDTLGNLIDQTVSDGAGRWYLQGPPTGYIVGGQQYEIVADISGVDSLGNNIFLGYTFSPLDEGADDTKDSDFGAATTLSLSRFQRSTGLILLSAGEFNEKTDLGLFKPFVRLSNAAASVDATTSQAQSVAEGDTGAVHQPQVVVTLLTGKLSSLSGGRTTTISPWDTQVYLSTVPVGATSDVDYQSHTADLVTIPAGQSTSSPVSISVLGDTTPEADERFQVKIVEPSDVWGFLNDNLLPGDTPVTLPVPDNSQVADANDAVVTLTILDDDRPVVTVDPGPTVIEGAPGTVSYAVFTIRLSSPYRGTGTATVTYALSNGTATGGVDYDNTGGTVEFEPGQLTKTVRVKVFGDFTKEGSETFFLTITGVDTTKLTPGATDQQTATATIVDLNMQSVTFDATKSVTYRDIAGNRVTITLKGPGSGTVVKSANGLGQKLQLTDTTEKSVLTIRTSGGQTTFTEINISGGLAALNAPTTNVNGSLTSAGAIRSLTVSYVSGGQIVLGPSGDPNVFVTLNIKRIVDASLDSMTAIKMFKLGSWIDTGTADLLTAPAIQLFRVTGDLGADVETTVGNIGTLIVGGKMNGSNVTVTPIFDGVTSGRINSIKVGSIVNSHVEAGKRIDSLIVRKLFSDTTIEAPQIGKLYLGRIQNTTSSVLTAATADTIDTVRWTFNKKTQTIHDVDNPGPRGLDKDLDDSPQIILQIT